MGDLAVGGRMILNGYRETGIEVGDWIANRYSSTVRKLSLAQVTTCTVAD